VVEKPDNKVFNEQVFLIIDSLPSVCNKLSDNPVIFLPTGLGEGEHMKAGSAEDEESGSVSPVLFVWGLLYKDCCSF
jgi:hypothetical protein